MEHAWELAPEDAGVQAITVQPPAQFELTREYFHRRGGLHGKRKS